MKYKILTADRLGARGADLVPWLQALALEAGAMRPGPWLREFQGQLIVDVAATRWIPGRAPEIAYPVMGGNGRPLMTFAAIGRRKVIVYAWCVPPVPVPGWLEPLAEPDNAPEFRLRGAGKPVGPAERARAAILMNGSGVPLP